MRALLGSLCILSGGALGIRMQMRERRRRRDLLRDLTAALDRMEEEIRLNRAPLPGLLSRLSEDCSGDAETFFLQVAEAVRGGEAPDAAWRREVVLLPLAERDRMILTEVSFQGDETALCGCLALLVRRLLRSREEREREEVQEIKRTAALWASGAALLVILLI